MTKKNVVNKELERLWKIWCKARNCDVTGQQSLNQILRMAVVRKKVDGGILFVKRYTRDGILPFSLQMLEVDELDSMPLFVRPIQETRMRLLHPTSSPFSPPIKEGNVCIIQKSRCLLRVHFCLKFLLHLSQK